MNNQPEPFRFFASARTLGVVVLIALLVSGCDGSDAGSGTGPGVSTLALFAGDMAERGSVDGLGAAARFAVPVGITTDRAGNVYVADTWNFTIRKITPAGLVTTLAGKAGEFGNADGVGAAARFGFGVFRDDIASIQGASGVAADSAGNVYVADGGNNTIRKIGPDGVVSTLAGTAGMRGSADGTGAAAGFADPQAVATDGAGNVYVADTGNATVRKITPAGVVTTVAGTPGRSAHADGTGAAARFVNPWGIAVDMAGNVYVSDSGVMRRISPGGVVTTLPGASGGGSPAIDSAGNIFVADTANNVVLKITPAGEITTLAGAAGVRGSADGTGSAARFFSPRGAATDSAGNVYVSDTGNHTVRKIDPAGAVTTLAGVAPVVGSADGIGAAASFDTPSGIAIDNAGNLYVADMNNTVRKITPAAAVTTLAGTADLLASTDGIGAAAGFSSPSGVATDGAGNVYVAESHTIRKITPAGVVTTLAGTPGVVGILDGIGAAAQFITPRGVATDSLGNIYMGDAVSIRKISPAGVVTTLARTAELLISCCGIGAQVFPRGLGGLATDSAGNVYQTHPRGYNTILKVTSSGLVTTLAGAPGVFGSADGIGTAATFNTPSGLALDSAGNLYVADFGNCTVRKIASGGTVTTVIGVAGQCGFVAGPLPGSLSQPVGIAIIGRTLYITMLHGVAVVTNLP